MILSTFVRDARELTRSSRQPPLWVLASDAYAVLALFRLRGALGRIPGVSHVLRLVQTALFGLELGRDVQLGHGVYFVHPVGTVVGGRARVGDRVRFMGANTVGSAHEEGWPVIDDDVTVGAGARLLGPIHVGRGAVIGANAVVLQDVPAGGIAVGVPAQIVKQKRRKSDGQRLPAAVDQRRHRHV
jgi:serine O-acetyltransferase